MRGKGSGEDKGEGEEKLLLCPPCPPCLPLLSTQHSLTLPTDLGACIAYRQRKTVRRG